MDNPIKRKLDLQKTYATSPACSACFLCFITPGIPDTEFLAVLHAWPW